MKANDVGSRISAALKAQLVLLYVAKQDSIPEAMRQFAKAEHFPDRDADNVDILKRGAQQMLASAANKARSVGVQDVDVEVEEGPIARTIVSRGQTPQSRYDCVGLQRDGRHGGPVTRRRVAPC